MVVLLKVIQTKIYNGAAFADKLHIFEMFTLQKYIKILKKN